jgi:hypothetical protein
MTVVADISASDSAKNKVWDFLLVCVASHLVSDLQSRQLERETALNVTRQNLPCPLSGQNHSKMPRYFSTAKLLSGIWRASVFVV